ncbi:hypothetical protein [Pontibacter mucosus]|uniref:hypothetical protein n=1 Tax=Pontibacter mucosus TaxID=1649266 RepID=UPI000D3B5DB1|nr:hypothetical protein [Pontibacter mucosus]
MHQVPTVSKEGTAANILFLYNLNVILADFKEWGAKHKGLKAKSLVNQETAITLQPALVFELAKGCGVFSGDFRKRHAGSLHGVYVNNELERVTLNYNA